MLECPTVSALELHPTAGVRDHLAACASCRIVVELLDERRRGLDARDREEECARFELLIAAREEGTIGGTAGELLAGHLRECADCAAVAATLVPVSDRVSQSALPAVSTASYALGREVARGGMGRILEALDVRIGRPVAVKELLGKAPALAARFEREARVTARLQHPGIVPIYEIGKWPDGTPFYAMRMVEGRTLREAIAGPKSLDERLALLPALIAATEAVAFAHAQRIIHRDLTPNNILVGAYGDTVVIDWGLAKDLSDPAEDVAADPYRDELSSTSNLTSAGAVIGTAAYMPPEQASGSAVDERADVYALGAILYHVLAGAPPYRATASEEVVKQVKAGPPPAVATIAAGAPRDLVSIVDKAMTRDPDARYATAAELAEELRRFQTGRVVEAHHYSSRERARRWIRDHRAAVFAAVAATIAIVIAGAIGFAGIVSERDHADRERAVAVEQRAAADSAKSQAERENTLLIEDQGRQELLAGNTTRALAWLNEAYKAGDTSEELRFMLGTAMQRIESIAQTFDCVGNVNAIAFSADGTRVMAACEHGIGIARIADWQIIAKFPVGSDGAIWSHDGHLIASKQWAKLTLLDAATGAPLFEKRIPGARLRSLAFTNDDRELVTTGDDAKVRVWDVATGTVVRTIDARSGEMNVVRGGFAPDGTFVTATVDGNVQTWDVATGARKLAFKLPPQLVGDVSHDEATISGGRLASCGLDGTARVVDLATGRVVATFVAHAVAGFQCSLSRDGRQLLTTGLDGTAKVWDVAGQHLVATLAHPGMMTTARFSPDGERVVTLGNDGVVKLWHAATGSLIASIDDPFGLNSQIAFSNDGRYLLSVREPSTIVVMKDLGADIAPRHLAPGDAVIATSPDARFMAIKGSDGAIAIADAATLTVRTREPIREPIAWSYDGARVAATSPSGSSIVLATESGAVIAQLPTKKPETLALDEHGHRLLVGTKSSEVWDVDHARLELALDKQSDKDSLARSGTLAVAWDGRRVEVWNLDRRHVQASAELDDDVVGPVGFDHDERHLTIAEHDEVGVVRGISPDAFRLVIVNTTTGASELSLPGMVYATLDATRRFLVASGVNAALEVRDATDGRMLSAFSPGPSSFMTGEVFRDGALMIVNDGFKPCVRSARDGRLLAELRGTLTPTFTQDTFQVSGADVTLANDGRSLIVGGAHPLVWTFPRETRTPAEIDRIVRTRSRWTIVDGRLRPLEAVLRGRVMRHGHPIAGAEVAVENIGVGAWPHVITDAQGRYELGALRYGIYGVNAIAADKSAKGTHRITIDRGEVAADLDLDDEATVSGQVTDDQGAPVPGVRVTAIDMYLEAQSDAGGRFAIHALPQGKVEVAVVEQVGGKPTGVVHVGPDRVPVELKSNTDEVSGVQLVVHRVATP